MRLQKSYERMAICLLLCVLSIIVAIKTDDNIPSHTDQRDDFVISGDSVKTSFEDLQVTEPIERVGVPIIDLSRLGKDVETSQAIDLALQEYGMFIGVNAMKKKMYDSSMRAAYDFFSIKLEDKLQIQVKSSGFMRGYIPFGKESGLLDKYFEPKEGYSYGYSFEKADDLPFRNALEGDNIWPDDNIFRGKKVMKFMFDLSSTVATNIARSISASFRYNTKQELGLILEGGERISIMRLFHYFSKSFNKTEEATTSEDSEGEEDDNNIIGSSPHTDWGLLTVITQQDQIGGLQFLYNGTWLDVPSDIPGSVIVNGGDFLSLMSSGRYKSPIHRVLAPKVGNRMSYVYFYYPNFHTPFDVKHLLKKQELGGKLNNLEVEYNTLVSGEDSVTSCASKDSVFGDFILNKWKGVFVAPEQEQ